MTPTRCSRPGRDRTGADAQRDWPSLARRNQCARFAGEGQVTPDPAVEAEEARQMLAVVSDYDDGNGPRPCVHTFVESGVGLIGAHWGVDDVLAVVRANGAVRSGPQAQAMGHGLAVHRPGKSPLFVATKEQS